MYEQSLLQVGLTKDQATVYEALVKNGPSPASRIARKTPLSRPLVYKILGELAEIELVDKKEEDGKVSIFAPAHPLKLKDFVEKKIEHANNAKTALEGVMGKLSSDFNLISGRPGVRFLDGLEGMRKIYDDILQTGEDFFLIRPIFGAEFEEKMVPIISEFVKERIRKSIKVTAITPNDANSQQNSENDAASLITRTLVDVSQYDSPVEINIYGNKIAILSYDKEFIGIVIESPQISKALKQLAVLAALGAARD